MKTKLLPIILFAIGIFGLSDAVRAQYCIPTYYSNCSWGDDINDFVLNGSGLSHYSSYCSPGGYGDFTSTPGLVANLQPTVSYSFYITHNYSSQYVKIFIDFNNDQDFDDAGELLFTSSGGSSYTTGSIEVPYYVAPVSGLRMRVMCKFASNVIDACELNASYGETHDYLVNILPPPPCPNPVMLTLDDVSAFTASVSWTEPNTANDYILEWGLAGFTPGTSSELGSANVSGVTNYDITGLTPSTNYDFYVRADCGVDGLSYWAGPLSFLTPCVAETVLPWTEDFESSSIGYQVFPSSCWIHENVGSAWYGWGVYDNFYNWGDADALSGTQFLSAGYGSDAYIWTPEFELSAGETYEFVFNWAGDENTTWFGEVLVSTGQSLATATILGAPFVNFGDETTLNYTEEIYCFTPDTDGTYSFGIHINEIGYWYYMNFDDLEIRLANPSAGTDATYDICATEGLVDLNVLGSITDPEGAWNFNLNPSAIVDDTLFNTSALPYGIHDIIYEPKGCLAPDVTVSLNIEAPSSAGNDGTLDACMNQQIDLMGALSGTVNFGGTWYDENDNAIASSYFKTNETSGTYNYYYVVSNGTCDADTAMVALTILTCDYLTIEENNTNIISVYPNPTSGLLYVNLSNTNFESISYSVTDLSGRVITQNNGSVETANNLMELDLSNVSDGIYLLNIVIGQEKQTLMITKK